MLPLFSISLLAALAVDSAAHTAVVHSGRLRQLDVRPPRIEAEVTIDGKLDEPVWQQAAVLTGFSRYAPTDNAPADDSTEVLVWYSPTAIHFGVRAYAQPGTVSASLADRDKMFQDDYVGIFLATFNDGKQATVFGANPLGVQGDGIVVERGASASSGFGGLQNGREPTDISPDYVFQSKGRVTDYGYEIEFRIPFKSLRYQAAKTQTWGINIIRKVQSRGTEDSWAPARRDAASYIAQFGKLEGLTDLARGMVVDINPVITSRSDGLRLAQSGAYDYSGKSEIGGNLRWGITNNLTLNATVNPDFAEVEADAAQVVYDPRQALYFTEKRPFFLDGIEQWAVPNQLIYTRRIVDPVAATKLTGRSGGTSWSALSALDSRQQSFGGSDKPLYDWLRVQRDLSSSARIGAVYTDRVDGDFTNRVAGVDSRIVWNKIYSVTMQAAGSRTTAPLSDAQVGGLAQIDVRRAGRSYGAQWMVKVMHDEFSTQSGLLSRPGVAQAHVTNAYRINGAPGAFVQNGSFEVALDGLWNYRNFIAGDDMLEKKLHFNNNFTFRGGWTGGASLLLESFGYDDELFSTTYVARNIGGVQDTVPFTGRARLTNVDYILSVGTPNFKTVSASASYVWGRDENFYEWTSGNIGLTQLSIDWRPTEQLRVSGQYIEQSYQRPSDGSTVARSRIPRVKAEYQITRSIFVRAVAEYSANFVDDLRESDRSNAPLFRRLPDGTFVRARGFTTATARDNNVNELRPQLLFSFVPSPGTVLYAGYGGTLREPRPFRFGRGAEPLERQRDAVFVKLSYLFRT